MRTDLTKDGVIKKYDKQTPGDYADRNQKKRNRRWIIVKLSQQTRVKR